MVTGGGTKTSLFMATKRLLSSSRTMSSWPKTRSRDFAVRWVIALVVLVVTAAVGLVPQLPVTGARADEITASQNLLRDGWDNSEPGLSPSVVGGPSSTFGRLFSTPVDGQVYGQPLVVGTTLIVTTENDFVYGLDARTGAIEWQQSLGQPRPSTPQDNCPDLTPDIGVTSTPVYDPASGNLYVTAVVNDGPATGQPHVYMYALNPQTGDVQWKVPIQGAPVNDPTRPFNPLSERQRPGLLLMNGWVYVGFASYCDFQPYDGYVAGVNTSTRALTMWTDESGMTDSEAGIWQGGGGLMSDGPNRIFAATGKGVSPAPGPGTKPPAELGDAVVRLAVGKDGTLSAQDFFSPGNAPALDAGDLDFGSGGPVGLPFGATSYPGLLVQAGKDGRVFLLNRDNLGGREQGPKGSDDAVSEAGPYQGQGGHPAAFADTATVTAANTGQANDYAYYVGSNDYLRYLKFGLNGSGTPTLTDVADSSIKFAFTSGSPVVTSNGTDPASALVWEVNAAGGAGANTLDAFDAVPAAGCTGAKPCSMSPVWSATIGTASKFSIPATNDGRVYVGTRDGHVLGFGSPDAAPVTGATPVNFGDVAVSTSSARLLRDAEIAVVRPGARRDQPAGERDHYQWRHRCRDVAVRDASHRAIYRHRPACSRELPCCGPVGGCDGDLPPDSGRTRPWLIHPHRCGPHQPAGAPVRDGTRCCQPAESSADVGELRLGAARPAGDSDHRHHQLRQPASHHQGRQAADGSVRGAGPGQRRPAGQSRLRP